MSEENARLATKFWIGALAFTVVLLAMTFALMAFYLSSIKVNTSAALVSSEAVAQRLQVLDIQVAAIQHHLVEQKVGNLPLAVPPANASVPTATPTNAPNAPMVKDITPQEMKNAADALAAGKIAPPAVNPPALMVPAVTPPPAPSAPAALPVPSKP